MAVNQSHTENRRGAIIPYGESVLQHCRDVDLSFPQHPQGSALFSGKKRGTLFLTSHRVIFVTSHSVSDPLCSFMMPFDLMSNCTVEQPVFDSNYIKGTIRAAPDGGWDGQATFKLSFRRGGAINFSQMLTNAASAAHPVVVFGPQPVRYGAPLGAYGTPPGGYGGPPVGYGAPPAGYGALPEGYGGPPEGYGAPPAGYRSPPERSEAPPMGYGAPPMGYGAPPPVYTALPVGYRAPPPVYEALPVGSGAPWAGYGTPPAEYGTPPAANGPPSAGYTAGSHNSAAAQPAGHESPLPSTSSPQAHSPSSKM